MACDQRLGIVEGRLLVEHAADRRRVEAAAARVPRILEDGEAELDLGVGQRLGRRRCVERRGRSKAAALSPQSSALRISAMACLARAVRPSLLVHSGGPAPRRVERRQRRMILRIDRAARGGRAHSFAHQRHDRVDLGNDRRGLGGGRGRGLGGSDRCAGSGARGRAHIGGRERIGRRGGAGIEPVACADFPDVSWLQAGPAVPFTSDSVSATPMNAVARGDRSTITKSPHRLFPIKSSKHHGHGSLRPARSPSDRRKYL